jgi:predicted PurR-regulated permease PerM
MVVFVAFLVASLLWGILGALIAIPTANIIRILIKEWADSRSQEPTTFAPQSDDDGSTPQGEPDARATRPP